MDSSFSLCFLFERFLVGLKYQTVVDVCVQVSRLERFFVVIDQRFVFRDGTYDGVGYDQRIISLSFDICDIHMTFGDGGLMGRELLDYRCVMFVHVIVVDFRIEFPVDVVLQSGVSSESDEGSVLDLCQGNVSIADSLSDEIPVGIEIIVRERYHQRKADQHEQDHGNQRRERQLRTVFQQCEYAQGIYQYHQSKQDGRSLV